MADLFWNNKIVVKLKSENLLWNNIIVVELKPAVVF